MRAALVAFAVLCVSPTFSTAEEDTYRLYEIEHAMRTPGVSAPMTWEDCGQVNAYYDHSERRIIMCRELSSEPVEVVRFIYAHELAHAAIMQRQVPYTGSHEMAADEMAAVMLTLYRHRDDVLSAADWFWESGTDLPPWADHPDDKERGFRLYCLVQGSLAQNAGCYHRWNRALLSWMRLLGYS